MPGGWTAAPSGSFLPPLPFLAPRHAALVQDSEGHFVERKPCPCPDRLGAWPDLQLYILFQLVSKRSAHNYGNLGYHRIQYSCAPCCRHVGICPRISHTSPKLSSSMDQHSKIWWVHWPPSRITSARSEANFTLKKQKINITNS